MQAPIVLARDCQAVQIPYGNTVVARAGTQVFVVHALGDTFTVRTPQGFMMRLAGSDHDALGQPPPGQQDVADDTSEALNEPRLWTVLKSCYDPEIPANIVDLGLIYSVKLMPLGNGEQRLDTGRVEVEMTLTAPGCGMGQVLKEDVERKMLGVKGVLEVDVRLVFSPPWSPEMMSESARLELGMF